MNEAVCCCVRTCSGGTAMLAITHTRVLIVFNHYYAVAARDSGGLISLESSACVVRTHFQLRAICVHEHV